MSQELKICIQKAVKELGEQVTSRGIRVASALRNAELEVLSGSRGGRVYRKPHTKAATYTASAPGEAPARKSGNLRLNWKLAVKKSSSGKGTQIISMIESGQDYASILEKGSKKIAPRPYKQRILNKAMPEVRSIVNELHQ